MSRIARISALILGTVMGFSAGSATAEVLYVDADGSAWADCTVRTYPCNDIRIAFERIESGDEVRVAQGTYPPGGVRLLETDKSIVIRGGYTDQFQSRT